MPSVWDILPSTLLMCIWSTFDHIKTNLIESYVCYPHSKKQKFLKHQNQQHESNTFCIYVCTNKITHLHQFRLQCQWKFMFFAYGAHCTHTHYILCIQWDVSSMFVERACDIHCDSHLGNTEMADVEGREKKHTQYQQTWTKFRCGTESSTNN